MADITQSPDAPAPVSMGTPEQGLLQNTIAKAGQSTDQMTQSDSIGVDPNQSLGAKSPTQQSAGTGEDSGMLSAIQTQYNQRSQSALSQLKTQFANNAPIQRANNLAEAARTVLGQQQLITAQNQFLTNAYNQNQNARAGFINSIFQTGGAVAGKLAANMNKNSTPDPVVGADAINDTGNVGGFDGGINPDESVGLMSGFGGR